METLLYDIILLMTKYPRGIKAREIALSLGRNRKEINQVLYANKNMFDVDEDYCWTLTNDRKRIELDKQEALRELREFYKVGYFEIQELEKLNGSAFLSAVENAKELSFSDYYFSLSEWKNLVLQDKRSFNNDFRLFKEKVKREREERAEKIRRNEKIKQEEIKRIKDLCAGLSAETKEIATAASQPNNFVSSVLEECLRFDVPEWKIQRIIEKKITSEQIRNNAMLIIYYRENYPGINLSVAENVDKPLDEVKKVAASLLPKEKERIVCTGDCSSCRREICIEDTNNR